MSNMSPDEHLQLVKRNTICSYGRGAKLVALPIIDAATGETQGLDNLIKGFVELISSNAVDIYDGFVAIFESKEYGCTISAINHTTATLLNALSISDPHKESCMTQDIESASWVFRFGGQSFYPLALGPCYPEDSSRYNGGVGTTYILFLPAAAFERRHQVGQNSLPQAMREKIRRDHDAASRRYDHAISLGDQECYKVVKPVTYGAKPIKWWN